MPQNEDSACRDLRSPAGSGSHPALQIHLGTELLFLSALTTLPFCPFSAPVPTTHSAPPSDLGRVSIFYREIRKCINASPLTPRTTPVYSPPSTRPQITDPLVRALVAVVALCTVRVFDTHLSAPPGFEHPKGKHPYQLSLAFLSSSPRSGSGIYTLETKCGQ